MQRSATPLANSPPPCFAWSPPPCRGGSGHCPVARSFRQRSAHPRHELRPLQHLDRRALERIADRLGPALEALLQEPLGDREEGQSVLGPLEAVPLVAEVDVGHGQLLGAHRLDDLVALGLDHARVVLALTDQERHLDRVHPADRRLRHHPRHVRRLGRIADMLVEITLEAGPPVSGEALHQRLEIRRPDDIDAAGEAVGGEGDAHQRRIAAIAAAHDRDLVGGRHPGLHRIVDRVEQVLVHLARPFADAGVDEALPEPRRAAIIDAHHRIAAVRQKLVHRVVAIAVARPRPAMDVEHHRHRPVRPAVAIGIGIGRKRQIADQCQSVLRLHLDRLHRAQAVARQVRAALEQLRQRPALAVVEIGDHGLLGRIGGDRRITPVVADRSDRQLALQLRFQEIEIGLCRGVERRPFAAQVIDRIGERLECHRIGQDVLHVRLVAGRQHRRLERRHVHRDQRRLVPPAAVGPVHRLAVAVEAARAGGKGVLVAEGDRLLPTAIGLTPEIGLPAARRRLRAEADAQLVVSDEIAVTRVLEHLRLGAGPIIDFV